MRDLNIYDIRFLNMSKIIRHGGYSNEGELVRARWNDGTPAYTKALFCQVERYDLSKGFPILTIRKINWKNALDEILWIWQKKSNKVSDLKSKIWDPWATYEEDGEKTIGKAYGYQLGKKYDFGDGKLVDQVDRLIYLLKNSPKDRRMITNIFNFDDLKDMGLAPCAFQTMWSTIGNKLNMTLVQRSGDTLTAAGIASWNVVQYVLLQYMIAQVTGFEVGEFVHIVNDLHVYDRHEALIDEMYDTHSEFMDAYIKSSNKKYFIEKLPHLIINKNIKDFYDFKVEDFELHGYDPDTNKKFMRFEVAE